MTVFMKEIVISVSRQQGQKEVIMSMNQTPRGERVHIGIFGKRNAGKSSLINCLTGQELAVVSEVKGTTTDPVQKAMELLPLGPVLLIDTPGLDDEGMLGEKRTQKTWQVLAKTDIAVLVLSVEESVDETEICLMEKIRERNLPYIVVLNKSDLKDHRQRRGLAAEDLGIPLETILETSTATGEGIEALKERLAASNPVKESQPLIRDLLEEGDPVVLVVPIDDSAPKGRLILPQQQVIRDVLEAGGIPVVTKDDQLQQTLELLSVPPRIVITDSQIFGKVAKMLPREIPLTSFSILMARYKGDLGTQIEGAKAIENLKDGDLVLISEGCTHHRQCKDIGTVKMPNWIQEYTKKEIRFAFTSGGEFPEDLSPYAMVVHCGGCTLNRAEMKHRICTGKSKGVPITNYGVMIAYIHGILPRVSEPFFDKN